MKFFNIKPFAAFCLGFAMAALVGTAVAVTHDVATWTGAGSRYNTVEFTIQEPAVGSAADLLPGTANANKVGNATYYMKDVISARHGFAVTITTTSTTPDYTAQLAVNAANELVISTGTARGAWTKVGAQ